MSGRTSFRPTATSASPAPLRLLYALLADSRWSRQVHTTTYRSVTATSRAPPPATTSLFPDMAGIAGGRSSPLALALLFNDREDLARPTRGWSIIAKASWVPNGLGNDFDYTRFTLDGSYLYPLLTRRQVLGLHIGGQYIDAKAREVPFYELASLGGDRDLRGYF